MRIPTPFVWCRELSSIIGVKPGDPDTGSQPSDPAELLPLAVSRPNDALLAARSLLAGQPSPYDASLAHHAIGIVLRDRGDLPAAITELRKGMRDWPARQDGPSERSTCRRRLGIALAWTGRSQQGLAVLDRAVEASRGEMAGRVLMRRADVLRDLGRFHEAHRDLSRALPYFRRAGDTVWEARSLTHRAEVCLGLGLPGRAAADFARAEELFATSGQELEYAKARHNRGLSGADPRRSSRGAHLLRRGREPLRRTRREHPRARHRPLLGVAGRRAGRRSGTRD